MTVYFKILELFIFNATGAKPSSSHYDVASIEVTCRRRILKTFKVVMSFAAQTSFR